jgi:glycosyltransferase involved in cell wall biosynthesis
VELVKFNRFGTAPHHFVGEGIRVTLLPRRSRGVQLAKDLWKRERRQAVQALHNMKVDVVHAHWTYEYARSALSSHLPHLITAHDAPSRLRSIMRPRFYWWPRLLQGYYVARRAHLMTAVSPYTAGVWQKEMHARCKVEVVPNGLKVAGEIPPATEASSWREAPVFVYVADGFDPRKNTKTLLMAFEQVKRGIPGATLILYGNQHGPDQAAFTWAKESNLTDRVVFKGRRPYSEVLQALREATVYVHPSLEESCCMAILEAMASRLPIVAGKSAGGIPWQLEEGRCGILCDVTSHTDLALAMEAALGKQDLADLAWSRFDQEFRIEHVAGRYLELLDLAASARN